MFYVNLIDLTHLTLNVKLKYVNYFLLATGLTTEIIYYFVDEASKTTRIVNSTVAPTNPPRTTTVPIKVIGKTC